MTWESVGKAFTFFGPSEHHSVMRGGFCISVFAIVRDGGKVLLGKPQHHPRWVQEWAPNWSIYDPISLSEEYRRWRFPSSYISAGEAPKETLQRVMQDQLSAPQYEMKTHTLRNYYGPSRRYPGEMHWDYVFLFEVAIPQLPDTPPWYSTLEYRDLSQMKEVEFGSAQGALLSEVMHPIPEGPVH